MPHTYVVLESGPLSVSLTRPLTLSARTHSGRTCVVVHLLLAVVSPLLYQFYICFRAILRYEGRGKFSHKCKIHMYIFRQILYRAEK